MKEGAVSRLHAPAELAILRSHRATEDGRLRGIMEKHEEIPSEKIINSWRETRLKEISEETETLKKKTN